MSVNYKNKLQEFCQKNRIDLPQYVTSPSIETSLFESRVSIFYGDNKTPLYADGFAQRKVDSEQKAAEGMCLILQSYVKQGYNFENQSRLNQQHQSQSSLSEYSQSVDVDSGKNRILVLIDLENITNGLAECFLKYNFSPFRNFMFQGFLSLAHHNATKPERFVFNTRNNGEQVNLNPSSIDSTRRDACDIAMIMYATRSLLQLDPGNVPDIIVVASGDKFAAALTDAINTGYIKTTTKKKVRCVHANNADEIGWRLNNLYK